VILSRQGWKRENVYKRPKNVILSRQGWKRENVYRRPKDVILSRQGWQPENVYGVLKIHVVLVIRVAQPIPGASRIREVLPTPGV
jgi:hypothetical protein